MCEILKHKHTLIEIHPPLYSIKTELKLKCITNFKFIRNYPRNVTIFRSLFYNEIHIRNIRNKLCLMGEECK